MDKRQWTKINRIVDTALDLNREERATYIKNECEDEALRRKVIELLDSIEQSKTEQFLEGTQAFPQNLTEDLRQTSAETNSSLLDKTIGNYKITALLGHGGMGSVFKAVRADGAYDSPIALKILRQGMDTPSNVSRFERERNILSKLDHPNIARLLDGGITENGLPYLVMEYVDGIPLHTYCEDHHLSIHDRISLFKEICAAVQHAQNNAIIHRDLKPSNILITNDGTVKVLDFGIAKLLKEDPEAVRLQTRTGDRILTLGYAAPEQLNAKPITAATDAYVLGILLYELLTGVSPLDIKKKGVTEIENTIRTKTPVKPSQRIQQLSESEKTKIAEERGCSVKALQRKLRGDIDAIVMKALRKEPQSRYRSAEQLLEDLNRWDENLPIIAGKIPFVITYQNSSRGTAQASV
ncbi:MAG: serine/threonine-protein kinase [Fodinibius sp.]|nr:serine/threonine-protein kinase [Fodinibius sp.]